MIASGAGSPPKRELERGPSESAVATVTTTMPANSPAPLTREEIRFLPDIPPLENDGNNFALWKLRIEMVLSLQDLWSGVVDGTDESETAPSPDAAADPKMFAEWKSRDLKARAQIVLTLKDEPLKSVLDATTARECWKGVSEYCRRTAIFQALSLVRKLFHTTLSDSKPLEPQIQELLWAARMLSNIGPGFQDNFIAMAILKSFPPGPSWSTLRTTLLDIEVSKLSSQFVHLSVISEEQRLIRDSGVDTTTYFANAARKGNGNGNGKGKRKREK
jgi:hypothetical protein